MYRDVTQWTAIRRQVLQEGVPIRQVARETGISRNTVRKMLDHPLPKPFGPRERWHPKLGPHTAAVQQMLQENVTLPPSARLSVKAIHECIRDEDGFSGSYSSVRRYVLSITRDESRIWKNTYDLLISLEKKQAIDFLVLLSRADSPVISPERTERFFRRAAQISAVTPDTHTREQGRQVAFEWMRTVLQKELSPAALKRDLAQA